MDYLESDDECDVAMEPESRLKLNRELDIARRIIEQTGQNLFLTGKAGTGKTTFLQQLRKTSTKRMVVLAPTGVAAINAGGITIHSFFQFPFSPFIPGKGFLDSPTRYDRFNRDKVRLIRAMDLLVIDEISMVRPDILDAIDSALRRHRDPLRPFGGVQLLLIGDLRQLAPVVKNDEWKLLKGHYGSPYFFESNALKSAGFTTVELTTIYRQNDLEFINLLGKIRDGQADDKTLSQLNRRFQPGFNPPDELGFIRLTTHNNLADTINKQHLAGIRSQEVRYAAHIKGNFTPSSFPADPELILKEGARVMFVKNDTGAERQYYNGLIGKIVGLDEEKVSVMTLDGSKRVIDVGKVEWESVTFKVNENTKEIEQHVDGTFSQIPLRLAWAITIHKSQGLTFEKAIINAAESFAPGQAYVALSRCKSLKGLVLDSLLPRRAVIVDSKVNDFIDSQNLNRPNERALVEMRASYFMTTLVEMFNFWEIKRAFDLVHRYVQEYIAPWDQGIARKFKSQEQTLERQVVEVGERFGQLYASRLVNPDEVSPELLEKTKAGCTYFVGKLAPIVPLLRTIPLRDLTNAEYQKRMLNACQNLADILKVKTDILKAMATESFTPQAYCRARSVSILEMEESAKSSPSKSKQAPKAKKAKKPKGYSRQQSMNLFLKYHDVERVSRERDITPATVIGHLAQSVKLGAMELAEFIADDKAALMKKYLKESNGAAYADLKQNRPASVSENEFSFCYQLYR